MSLFLHVAYYRNAMGILLVYDVADEGSFKNVRNWMQNIKEHASEKVNKARMVAVCHPCPRCIVAVGPHW